MITVFRSHFLGISEQMYTASWTDMGSVWQYFSWSLVPECSFRALLKHGRFFFLINIFSMSWILMEMTIYKWRCSSWGLSQWSLRTCSNWHCFNLYFPHSPVLAHKLISLSYIHWTSNAYGSVHFFIKIFRSSGSLRQLFFWFPPVFPDAMWSLKRISQGLTFRV